MAMFTTKFSDFACAGDTITCEVNGLTVTARIERDDDADAPDRMQDGFWPSLDPNSAGYIGPKSKRTLVRHQMHATRVMDAWRADDWYFCGIVLSVERDSVMLAEHAASLWRIECNWPRMNGKTDNSYLLTVANELLPEALSYVGNASKE